MAWRRREILRESEIGSDAVAAGAGGKESLRASAFPGYYCISRVIKFYQPKVEKS